MTPVPTLNSKQHRSSGFSWLLLVLVAFTAYFNAMPNELVFDDREFLGAGRFEHMTLSDYGDLFSQMAWEGSAVDVELYRPMLLVSFGVQTLLFGEWLAGYHLLNVVLHILATLLVFGLVREVLTSLETSNAVAARSALPAALIFAVHPAFTEVVNSVFNGSEIYVTIAAAGGLWYVLRTYRTRPVAAWSGLALVYFCALLFRESAVSIPALAVVLVWFTSEDPWRTRVAQCLPAVLLALPLALYFVMRSQAIDAPVSSIDGLAPAVSSPAQAQAQGFTAELARVSPGVSMWFDALRLMVWPHPLSVMHEDSTTPFWLAFTAQLLLLACALYLFSRSRPAMIAGLCFFYIAIFPSSRILGDTSMSPMLLERMLYLPSVGLVICLAAGFAWLAVKKSVWAPVIAVAPVVVLFTFLTWNRNDDWANELRLLEGDLKKNPRHGHILYAAIRANARAGNPKRSAALCSDYAGMIDGNTYTSMECANVNAVLRRFDTAESLYRQAIAIDAANSHAYFHQARMLLHLGRRDEARALFEQAAATEKKAFLREFMTATMLAELHPNDKNRLLEAKSHFETALRLQPRFVAAARALEKLDQKLGTPYR